MYHSMMHFKSIIAQLKAEILFFLFVSKDVWMLRVLYLKGKKSHATPSLAPQNSELMLIIKKPHTVQLVDFCDGSCASKGGFLSFHLVLDTPFGVSGWHHAVWVAHLCHNCHSGGICIFQAVLFPAWYEYQAEDFCYCLVYVWIPAACASFTIAAWCCFSQRCCITHIWCTPQGCWSDWGGHRCFCV